jgi:hypothetical protein
MANWFIAPLQFWVFALATMVTKEAAFHLQFPIERRNPDDL